LRFTADAPISELAKKCRELSIKAHPPQQASPYAQAERDYFSECVKNNGKMQDGDDKKAK